MSSNPRTWRGVIEGSRRWSCEAADAIEWLKGLPDDSIDLLVTSPPYERARTYGLNVTMPSGEEWVGWMRSVVEVAATKVKGLIAINCEGQTKGYRYSAVPFLLMADLHRSGYCLRKPLVYHRIGIPGSGGPDWLRNDWEPIVCVTRGGKLPWSDNTACGQPPKFAPGGEPSHRTEDGRRTNANLSRAERGRLRREAAAVGNGRKIRAHDSGEWADSTVKTEWNYVPPDVANPGNVLKVSVGGGRLGHDLAHDNEAPFSLDFAEFFVRSFCPPSGIVADPFSGSGTTCHAAIEWGRRFVGCDIRESQVKLCERRLATVTPRMMEMA